MKRLMPIVFCALMAACSAERKPGELFGPAEPGTLVVDALLIVDHPLPDLFVRETVSPGEIYTRAGAAVTDAEVEIRQGDRTFRYRMDPDSLGRYLPPQGAPSVMPHTDYHLTVRSGGREATAITQTPERLRFQEVVFMDETTLQVKHRLKTFADGADLVFTSPENRLTYLEGLLEVRFQPIDVPAYQVGIFNLESDSERVFESDLFEEEDYEDLERQESSPPFEAMDGTLRMPWFFVYFAGRHIIKIYALDRNWFDFARSGPANDNGGFGGLAGDNFERPVFHVEGGIGLFGSASVDSLGFVVLPRK